MLTGQKVHWSNSRCCVTLTNLITKLSIDATAVVFAVILEHLKRPMWIIKTRRKKLLNHTRSPLSARIASKKTSATRQKTVVFKDARHWRLLAFRLAQRGCYSCKRASFICGGTLCFSRLSIYFRPLSMF